MSVDSPPLTPVSVSGSESPLTNLGRSSVPMSSHQHRTRLTSQVSSFLPLGREGSINLIGEGLTREEVHGIDSDPLLPSAAVPAMEETKLHDPRWSALAGNPNAWARFRHIWREEFAEFLSSFFIILFGAGVEAQVKLHYGALGNAGTHLSCRLAWAAGVALSGWVGGGISGGHCNPTVTIVLSIFRGFPKRKVPGFIIAQVLGCAVAALVVYSNYYNSITMYEGSKLSRSVFGDRSTAGIFFTVPQPWLPTFSSWLSEFIASAALIIAVFSLGDTNNLSVPKGCIPFAMFIVLLGIGAALGVNTGYAMNGARDTGPRIACWIVGYGNEVWTHHHGWFFWGPWFGAIAGGIFGALVYDVLLYTGLDSPLNRPEGGRKHNSLPAYYNGITIGGETS